MTTLAMEGLRLRGGRDLAVADEASEMPEAVVELLDDPQRRLAFGQSARRAALEYDWSTIGIDFCTAFEEARSLPLRAP